MKNWPATSDVRLKCLMATTKLDFWRHLLCCKKTFCDVARYLIQASHFTLFFRVIPARLQHDWPPFIFVEHGRKAG